MTPQQSPSHLPSLPQVLARILDAVYGEELSFQQLAEVIHQDPAIAARILAVANSTSHAPVNRSQTVERALLVLGLDTVKTIVITAAIRQFFNSFGRNHHGFLQTFWRRSLTMASLARQLATVSGLVSPDQAYLAGLLADLGQLVLLQQYGQHYLELHDSASSDQELLAAERIAFATVHSRAGAGLVERWRIDPTMAAAIRQHHEPAQQLAAAPPLVKIINLASLLSLPEPGVSQASLLLDLNDELVDELRARAQRQMRQLAQALDIDTDDAVTSSQQGYDQLGRRLSQIWELEQTRAELSRAEDQTQLQESVLRVACLLTGVEQPLLFLRTTAGTGLQLAAPSSVTTPADLTLPLEPGLSCISDALLQQRLIISEISEAGTASQPGSFEHELLQQLGQEQLLCLPLIHEAQSLGVLVLGISSPLPMPDQLLQALGREIAHALTEQRNTIAANSAAQLQQRIDEAVHEAGNPLSIIGNYLEMLRLRLRTGQPPTDEISLIQGEINRVGAILLRLKTPQPPEAADSLDLNHLIEELARILENSLFAVRNLKLELRLSPAPLILPIPAGPIKQILINLLKNAAEALPAGAAVLVSTTADVEVEGELFTGITLEDNGPGIPLSIMNALFSSGTSTKGNGHPGLGLSITKRLVDDLSGRITCESGPWGTRFQILIPQ